MERPNLSAEQVDVQLKMEWEFLSPNKRRKYAKRNSIERADIETPSPEKRHKKSLKRKKPVSVLLKIVNLCVVRTRSRIVPFFLLEPDYPNCGLVLNWIGPGLTL